MTENYITGTYPTPQLKPSIEELTLRIAAIEAEEKRFALEIVVEEEAKMLREMQLKRLESVITLDDIFSAFMANSLCRNISAWARKED